MYADQTAVWSMVPTRVSCQDVEVADRQAIIRESEPKVQSKKWLWKGFCQYWPETLYCFYLCFITGPSYCHVSVCYISINYAICVFIEKKQLLKLADLGMET